MFTGIIEQKGRVREVVLTDAGVRIVVDAPGWRYRAVRGDSVAVNGCCLTAIASSGRKGRFAFDVIPETLSKTTLGGFAVGREVNLEHAARADALLGGHIVQGHVDGVGEVVRIRTGGEWRVRIRPPAALMEYMTPKGSVSLDGVSLTLAGVGRDWIEVALIPTTLDKTVLGEWRKGSTVNIEADVLAKTIVAWMQRRDAHRGRKRPKK